MASCYNATHVVVQVEYGADAIFILRKRIDNRNEENKINDELKVCAENLRKVLEGSGVCGNFAERGGERNGIVCHFKGNFIFQTGENSYISKINVVKIYFDILINR